MPLSDPDPTSPQETAAPAGPPAGATGIPAKLLAGQPVQLPEGLGFVLTLDAAFSADARYRLNPDYLRDARRSAVWRLVRPDGSAAMVGRVTLGGKGNQLRRSLERNHGDAVAESVLLHVQQVNPQEAAEWRSAWLASDRPPGAKLPKDADDILEDYEHEVATASTAVANIVAELLPHLPAEVVASAITARTANEEARSMLTPDTNELIRQLADERAYGERIRTELEAKDATIAAMTEELEMLRRRSALLTVLMDQPETETADPMEYA